MKKQLLLMFFVCLAPAAWSAGTCKTYSKTPDDQTVIVTLSCTADTETGAFPDTAIPSAVFRPIAGQVAYNLAGHILYQANRTPSAPFPTSGYTIKVNDTFGTKVSGKFAANDIAQGLLSGNGSATAPQVTILTADGTVFSEVRSPVIVTITGNSVKGAKVMVDLIFRFGQVRQ